MDQNLTFIMLWPSRRHDLRKPRALIDYVVRHMHIADVSPAAKPRR